MLSKNFFGQRKRRREQADELENKQLPPMLRLVGGAGRGRGRGRGVGFAVGHGVFGALAYDFRNPARLHLHQQWNLAAHPAEAHWDISLLQEQPYRNVPEGPQERIEEWKLMHRNDGYAWQHGPPIPMQIDLKANLKNPPEPPPISNWRAQEINQMRIRGEYFRQWYAPNLPAAGGNIEPLWSFLGMADSKVYGLAWSCFYYCLSDIYAGGFGYLSHILVSIVQIMQDILDITNGVIVGGRRCVVLFEGRTDPDDVHARDLISCTPRGLTLNSIMNDPTELLMIITRAFTSKADFLFYRVFVNVLRDAHANGGNLANMPENFKKLRDGPFFKGIKAYNLIDDSEDCSCGLDAVIWALANSLRRIKKICKAISKAPPELCDSFDRLRRKLSGTQTFTKKGKLLFVQTKAKLASYIGWKCGTPISPEELCEAVSKFADLHHVDIGLIIFDAIQPLTKYICNYDPNIHVPQEILCLVHWQYPSIGEVDEKVSYGHYDCINSCNVTRWIQGRHNGRKDYRFSFKRFCLIPSHEADDKGLFCEWCKYWQRSIPLDEWNREHGGIQKENKFLCLECKVSFKSQKCLEQHRIPNRSQGNPTAACRSATYCEKCARVHILTYDCSFTWCPICQKKYPSREKKEHTCYLGYISDKKGARLRKVIYSDMEGSRKSGQHVAVCISSCWTEMCETHNYFYTNRSAKCKACLLNTDNWGWFCNACQDDEKTNECENCKERHTNYFFGPNCLTEYMDWLMENYTGSTVVFHNGGKYDLQILVIELLTTGKYILSKDAMRGSQIIFFTVSPINCDERSRAKQVRFIDSCNFIQSSLRNFSDMFDLKNTEKGRFPYDLLNEDKWESYRGKCPPPSLFGITKKELQNVEKLHPIRKKEVDEILEYIKNWNASGKEWVALEILEEYTVKDTIVLHDGCELFRFHFWSLVGCDPFQWVTLPAAVAGSYRQPEFMPENSIQIFNNQDREWQRQGLRGGRCEPFVLYWKKTKPTQTFKLYDVNSEYPYVQAFKNYPEGKCTVDLKYNRPVAFIKAAGDFLKRTDTRLDKVLQDPSGNTGVGIIECVISCGNAHIPILPAKVKHGNYVKNMYMNRSGAWIGYITVLAEACKRNHVIIRSITRIQYWKKTSDTLFRNYICRLYGAKVGASGWGNILNKKEELITEDEKKEFIRISGEMGIEIEMEKVSKNPGLRSTSKIMNNCVWGYLCQKPNANENHFFDNFATDELDEMGDMLENLESDRDPRRMIGEPAAVGHFTRIRTTKKPEDITIKEMNKKIAYQTGGQVPAYGLQLLTNGIYSLDPSQVVYVDTDSIAHIIDSDLEAKGIHKRLPTGNYIGMWVDEYPDMDITEFCSTGCKSYFIKLESKDGKKITYKGRFKGVPMGSSSFSLTDPKGEIARLGMEEMKKLLFSAILSLRQNNEDEKEMDVLTYEFNYTNFFKRNPDYKITQRQEKKTIRFTYDKREVIIPECLKGDSPNLDEITEIRTKPKDDLTTLTENDIQAWWGQVGYDLDLLEQRQ